MMSSPSLPAFTATGYRLLNEKGASASVLRAIGDKRRHAAAELDKGLPPAESAVAQKKLAALDSAAEIINIVTSARR